MRVGDRVRLATPDDAPRITEIYNQGIQDRIATFEKQERTVETVRSWFELPYPIVVVERAGEVIAWANASQYRPRDCYAGICEFSVYVDRSARGTGAGRAVMEGLIHAAAKRGYHKLVSRVFVENTGSRSLLAKLGFREVGIYERHGQLDGIWRDCVIVERLLEAPTPAGWIAMSGGQMITIAKTHLGSSEPDWTYDGVIVPHDKSGDWIVADCHWGRDYADVEGVKFIRGGKMIEYFSTTKRFNIFQVFAPNGEFTGIYANVTAPTRFSLDEVGQPVITWEDHWLDAVKLPDGTIKMLDEDEYEATGIPQSDPELHRLITGALEELLEALRSGIWDA